MQLLGRPGGGSWFRQAATQAVGVQRLTRGDSGMKHDRINSLFATKAVQDVGLVQYLVADGLSFSVRNGWKPVLRSPKTPAAGIRTIWSLSDQGAGKFY